MTHRIGFLPTHGAALCAAALLASAAAGVHAQSGEAATSRIDKVTLYQGSATVERTLRVPAGAREAQFVCLPAALDTQTLQVNSDVGVRIGELRVQTTERALESGCASPLDAKIRALQDELAGVSASVGALQLVDSYLKTVAGSSPAKGERAVAPPTAAQIQATADALRSSAEDGQKRTHQLQRQKEDLELRLKPLLIDRERTAGQRSRVVSVRVQLASEREATLRLAYQVRGPNWQSSYRATLDADTSKLRIERQAIVAQASGEDWSGVQLRLSTGTPQRSSQGSLPRPWTLDLAPPTPPPAPAPAAMSRVMSAPAPAAVEAADMAGAGLPDFEVQTTENAYATEFSVPGRTNVPSSGERITLALGSADAPARLLTRTAPAVEPAAYLVAELARPAGVWPAGPVALMQGTRFVGNGRLDFTASGKDTATTELAFGRDDQVTVRAEPVKEQRGSVGLTGSRTERTVQSLYHVDNRHAGAIELQVLHAAPVSRDEKIEVTSRYTPKPASLAFGDQPGTVLWQQSLAGGASATFAFDHVLSYPKDAPLREHR
ncbi:MAG: DUF4139 domain-containing protein [Giesbergeria sp.]